MTDPPSPRSSNAPGTRGELLGSSAPHGDWLVPMSLSQPDLVAVAEADGGLVGWVHPEAKALVVEPAFRRQGIGRALVDEGLRMERGRERPNLLLGLLPDEPGGHGFVEATGFAFHSTLWDLDLAADVEVAPPDWPAGITTRDIEPPGEIAAWVDAVQRGVRRPRDAAPARRGPARGDLVRVADAERGPAARGGRDGPPGRVLRHRAAPSRRRRGGAARGDLDGGRPPGPAGPRARSRPAPLGHPPPARARGPGRSTCR